MKIGVCVPNYGETSSAESIQMIATEAERLGLDSVWCTDHVLMQKNSGTPYENIFDSITTLAFLAKATSKARLGFSSLITAMRNPVVVAKQLATIDNLSNGRLILATSAGWNEPEFRNLGSNFHNRGRRLDESLRLIRSLWSGETKFDSKTLGIRYDDVSFEPRPIQTHVPIWIAGNSPAAMRRASKYGDGWHPNMFPIADFQKMVDSFRSRFSEASNRELTVRIGINTKATTSEYRSPQGERRVLLSSDRAGNRRILQALTDLGVGHLVAALSPDGKKSLTDQIDGMRMLIEDYRSVHV